MRFLALVAFLALTTSHVHAQNVLSAEPSVRVDSNGDETSRRQLSAVERAQNRVIIIRQGNRYLWASREGRELIRVDSGGAFTLFLDAGGTGYVKVLDRYRLFAGAEK